VIRSLAAISVLAAAPAIRAFGVARRATEVGAATAVGAWCSVSGLEATGGEGRHAGVVLEALLTAKAARPAEHIVIAGRLHEGEDDVRRGAGRGDENYHS